MRFCRLATKADIQPKAALMSICITESLPYCSMRAAEYGTHTEGHHEIQILSYRQTVLMEAHHCIP